MRSAILRLPLPNYLDGLRGFALLWLRITVALVLVRQTAGSFAGGQELEAWLIGAGAACVGVGLLTMAGAPLIACVEIAGMIRHSHDGDWSRFLIMSILVALAVLGPGAYSIDRWLFGRKRLTIGPPAR